MYITISRSLSDVIYEIIHEFHSINLRKITCITNTDDECTNDELMSLVKCKRFKRVFELDLSNQVNLTDEHIKLLSRNRKFAFLKIIKLDNCNNITIQSLRYLRDSEIIGSKTTKHTFCDKHCVEYTKVEVSIYGTNAVKDTNSFHNNKLRNFEIKIKTLYEKRNCTHVETGIKIIQPTCVHNRIDYTTFMKRKSCIDSNYEYSIIKNALNNKMTSMLTTEKISFIFGKDLISVCNEPNAITTLFDFVTQLKNLKQLTLQSLFFYNIENIFVQFIEQLLLRLSKSCKVMVCKNPPHDDYPGKTLHQLINAGFENVCGYCCGLSDTFFIEREFPILQNSTLKKLKLEYNRFSPNIFNWILNPSVFSSLTELTVKGNNMVLNNNNTKINANKIRKLNIRNLMIDLNIFFDKFVWDTQECSFCLSFNYICKNEIQDFVKKLPNNIKKLNLSHIFIESNGEKTKIDLNTEQELVSKLIQEKKINYFSELHLTFVSSEELKNLFLRNRIEL